MIVNPLLQRFCHLKILSHHKFIMVPKLGILTHLGDVVTWCRLFLGYSISRHVFLALDKIHPWFYFVKWSCLKCWSWRIFVFSPSSTWRNWWPRQIGTFFVQSCCHPSADFFEFFRRFVSDGNILRFIEITLEKVETMTAEFLESLMGTVHSFQHHIWNDFIVKTNEVIQIFIAQGTSACWKSQ